MKFLQGTIFVLCEVGTCFWGMFWCYFGLNLSWHGAVFELEWGGVVGSFCKGLFLCCVKCELVLCELVFGDVLVLCWCKFELAWC